VSPCPNVPRQAICRKQARNHTTWVTGLRGGIWERGQGAGPSPPRLPGWRRIRVVQLTCSLVVQVVLEEANHHLIPVLLAPGNILCGVGVVRVGCGVVVMNNEFELGPFG